MGLPRRKVSAAKKVTDEELTLRVRRFFRVRDLLESPAWKEDLLPFLEGELKVVGRNTTWHPGSGLPKLESIALGCAYQGGREDALVEVGARVQSWYDEGKRAKEALERREKTEEKP